jgi:hypothetical protein
LVLPELTSFSSVQSVLDAIVGAIDDLAAQGSDKQ